MVFVLFFLDLFSYDSPLKTAATVGTECGCQSEKQKDKVGGFHFTGFFFYPLPHVCEVTVIYNLFDHQSDAIGRFSEAGLHE